MSKPNTPSIVCFRPAKITGKFCGNCGWARDQGPLLKCRNPSSPKADQNVEFKRDTCGKWMKDRTA